VTRNISKTESPGVVRNSNASPCKLILLARNIKISRRKVIRAFVINTLFCVLLIFSLHLFGEWTISDGIIQPINSSSLFKDSSTSSLVMGTTTILDCYNECLLFKQTHQTVIYMEEDRKDFEFAVSHFRVVSSLKFTFENHLLAILLISLLAIPISYFLLRIKDKTN
jgi:hypothetical protein